MAVEASGLVLAWSSAATGAWLTTMSSASARWSCPPQSTTSSSRRAPGKVRSGTVKSAVNPPLRSPVTSMRRSASPRKVSVPARSQKPVLPTTFTGRPGEVAAGSTDEMTGTSVTVTVTVAAPQLARPAASSTSSQRL
jgi:hypothetical protein